MQRASIPSGTGARHGSAAAEPGCRGKLGRQTAVSNATRKDDLSRPGALLVSTTAMPLGSSNVSASAEQRS